MPNSVATSARHTPRPENPRVVILAYDKLCLFEFGVAIEIFALPRPELEVPWYDCVVAAVTDQEITALGGVQVRPQATLEALPEAGTIVIPGWTGMNEPVPEALCTALRSARERGARLLSICSGAVVLAAAGLLDGRRATTHWRYTDALAAAYPRIELVPDVLYVDEGDVLTSAGSAAGIDLCLHLVRRDFGPRIANQVAQRLVVPPHRDGGQAQYVPQPVPVERDAAAFGELFDWLLGALQEPLTIPVMARRVRMSERTFVRRFRDTAGCSPGEWLARARVEKARELLESTSESIEWVADACGFGTAATLRHHFRSRLGVKPSAYRARFQQLPVTGSTA